MAKVKKTFQEVSYEVDSENHELSIDDKKVEIIKEGDQYLSAELPYQYFDNLDEIAECLISCSPNYKSQ